MKSLVKKYGLSARRKTTKLIRCSGLTLFIAVFVLLSSCHEPTKGQDSKALKNKHAAAADRLTKPQVNIKVNRRYDEKGNMIGFDSTYSSFYSNLTGDTAQMDSLMSSFDRYFNSNHSSFFKNEFNPLFFNDSMRYPDFFHGDFFQRRYELNDAYFKDMMLRMDSIKNRFYREHSKKLNNRGEKDL